MSEQKHRLAQALRTHTRADTLMIEAANNAMLLCQQAAEEMAALSNEVDESPITLAALAPREAIASLKEMMESYRHSAATFKLLADKTESEA